MYATCGITSLLVHHFDYQMELYLRRALCNLHVIGIGVVGLDFGRYVLFQLIFRIFIFVGISESQPDNNIQVATFIKQLRLVKEKDLPVVIISRNSFIETLKCLTTVRSHLRE
jgi:Tat protein secretion system quality control protein TatD with DNase activity